MIRAFFFLYPLVYCFQSSPESVYMHTPSISNLLVRPQRLCFAAVM
jgi:hypothetical protein